MAVIRCGWCGHTTPDDRCTYCGRNPTIPWEHRDLTPPVVDAPDAPGRPTLEAEEVRRLYGEARRAVVNAGRPPTVEAIAEQLDRSPRTVREWRKRFGLE